MRRIATVSPPSGKSFERDAGKKFLLTEMSARRSEKWATRVLLALLAGGVEIPDDVLGAGMAGVAAVSSSGNGFLRGGIAFETVEPLLDEMLECVQIAEQNMTRELTEDDIEEVATLVWLRGEVLQLHVGFSIAERISAYLAARKSMVSLNTPTSSAQ